MPKITSFRDLIAWQKAMALADMIDDLTEHFPPRQGFISTGDSRRVEDRIAKSNA